MEVRICLLFLSKILIVGKQSIYIRILMNFLEDLSYILGELKKITWDDSCDVNWLPVSAT